MGLVENHLGVSGAPGRAQRKEGRSVGARARRKSLRHRPSPLHAHKGAGLVAGAEGSRQLSHASLGSCWS